MLVPNQLLSWVKNRVGREFQAFLMCLFRVRSHRGARCSPSHQLRGFGSAGLELGAGCSACRTIPTFPGPALPLCLEAWSVGHWISRRDESIPERNGEGSKCLEESPNQDQGGQQKQSCCLRCTSLVFWRQLG